MPTDTSTISVASAPLGDDLLRGVPAIAAFIGEKPSRTYYMCERGYLPVGREGSLYVASRQVLKDHYVKLTSGAEVRRDPAPEPEQPRRGRGRPPRIVA